MKINFECFLVELKIRFLVIYPTFSGLEELAEEISTSADCGWQLRLYSYDSKTAGSDVYKVG